MSDDGQSKRWCFTINNPTDVDGIAVVSLADHDQCMYLVAGDEVGESGTKHIQGFVCFNRAWRFKRLKKFLGDRVHLEAARGTSEQASEYCKKDGKFQEYGDVPEDCKITSELNLAIWDEARKLAREGRFDEIRSDLYVRYRNSFHAIHEEFSSAKECISSLDGIWIMGGTGIGKSKYAWDNFPDAYRKPLNKWWDHYVDQEVVVIEDIDPSHGKWLGAFLKVWSDHYPYICERKGGSKLIRPKKFVVTSNYSISECFTDAGIHVPLQRRFAVKTIRNGCLENYVPDAPTRFVQIGPEHFREV